MNITDNVLVGRDNLPVRGIMKLQVTFTIRRFTAQILFHFMKSVSGGFNFNEKNISKGFNVCLSWGKACLPKHNYQAKWRDFALLIISKKPSYLKAALKMLWKTNLRYYFNVELNIMSNSTLIYFWKLQSKMALIVWKTENLWLYSMSRSNICKRKLALVKSCCIICMPDFNAGSKR